MSMFTQYFPYNLAPGLSLEAEKEEYADRCFDHYESHANPALGAEQWFGPAQRFAALGVDGFEPLDAA